MTGWRHLLVLGKEADAVADRVRAGLASGSGNSDSPDVTIVSRGFREVTPEDVQQADMLLTFLIPDSIALHLGGIRWVQSVGAGVDAILDALRACRHVADDVLVTRVTGVFGRKLAEYVLARCLAISQEIPRLEEERRQRNWKRFFPRSLSDLCVAVVGAGDIGIAIGRSLKVNGARVIGVRRSPPAADSPDALTQTRSVRDLSDVLAEADIVVLVVPLTDETRGLMGRAQFERMIPGSWLINVARGPVVDEDSLIAALRSGHLGGAALDVFQTEPLPPESPLWTMKNVMISPHVAGVTTADEAAAAFVENFRRIERGDEPVGRVDLDRGY